MHAFFALKEKYVAIVEQIVVQHVLLGVGVISNSKKRKAFIGAALLPSYRTTRCRELAYE
jgi:hypothetical protein